MTFWHLHLLGEWFLYLFTPTALLWCFFKDLDVLGDQGCSGDSVVALLVNWNGVLELSKHIHSCGSYHNADGEFHLNISSWFVAYGQLRQLYLLWRRHKVKADLHRTDEAQNKAETRVCSYLAPCKNHLFIAKLAAGFAAKGLLNLITSSPVATGLAHWYSSFDSIKFSLGERCLVLYINLPSCEFTTFYHYKSQSHELICGFRSV